MMDDHADEARLLRLLRFAKRVVRRTVVHDDDLEGFERLPVQGCDGMEKAGSTVEGGQDHADRDAARRFQDRRPPGPAQHDE